MKYEITSRLTGTKHEYFTLKIWKEGKEEPIVHSSKKRSYLVNLLKEYK